MGPLEVDDETRRGLVDHASDDGALTWSTEDDSSGSTERVLAMLQLIVATRQYQLA